MRRFYAPKVQFDGKKISLDEHETRHLRDVLRLKTGDEINVFDGRGREYRCTVEKVEKRITRLNLIEETESAAPESNLDLTLAATMLKGDKFDLTVQKSVELGVNHLIPMETIRCDVKAKDAAKRIERWRKIALEATKQCGRAKLMTIGDLMNLETVIAETEHPIRIMFSERDGDSLSEPEVVTIGFHSRLLAFIGPEGGWDDKELENARRSGIRIVTFGGRVLRAETAAISIAAILQHRCGDLN